LNCVVENYSSCQNHTNHTSI